MPSAFTPSPDEAMAEPNAADLAAGIVSPMDIPIRTPIPILHIKTTEYARKRQIDHYQRGYRKARKLDGIPDVQTNRFQRLQKFTRMRSSFKLPVSDLSKNLQEMDEDFHVSKNYINPCKCFACNHLRRWSSTLQRYRCKATICDITFESFTDLFEHQLEVHGALDPSSSRVVSDVFHQHRGKLALPPATVYAGQQYMYPSRAPIPWKSMEELDAEAKVLYGKLQSYNRECFATLYRLFNIGYQLVKRTGWSEMKRQYELAMEHFYSAMKYPATSRLSHDGCPSVERGRNWLTSTDRDDTRFLCPINVADKIEEEPEFVLIDTKRDEEKKTTCIEINDDADGEDASGNNRTASENKIFKTDDDVEPEEGDGKPATVDEDASDSEDAVAVKFEAEDVDPVPAVDFHSDSDETVMSDADADHNIAELVKPEDSDDSDSDNDRDNDSGAKEDEGMVEGGNYDRIGDIDDSDTEEELKPSQGVGEDIGNGSDSDSDSSEDEVELKPATDGDDIDSDTSSDDEEEQELKSKAGNEDDSDSTDEEEEELRPSTRAIEGTFSDSSSEDELKPSTGNISDSDSDEDQTSSNPIVHEVVSSSEDSEKDEPRAQEDIFNQLE